MYCFCFCTFDFRSNQHNGSRPGRSAHHTTSGPTEAGSACMRDATQPTLLLAANHLIPPLSSQQTTMDLQCGLFLYCNIICLAYLVSTLSRPVVVGRLGLRSHSTCIFAEFYSAPSLVRFCTVLSPAGQSTFQVPTHEIKSQLTLFFFPPEIRDKRIETPFKHHCFLLPRTHARTHTQRVRPAPSFAASRADPCHILLLLSRQTDFVRAPPVSGT